MPRKSKKIALFGGSFDPPHRGHYQIIDYLEKQKKFDEIWILPNFTHAFGKKTVDFNHRRKMCDFLTDGFVNVSVCAVEGELQKSPSYTTDILDELIHRYPNYNFYLVVGSDVKNDLHRWKDIEKIKMKALFYFLPRSGFEDSPFLDVSSSEIRDKIQAGQNISDLVLDKVKDYIRTHDLYNENK